MNLAPQSSAGNREVSVSAAKSHAGASGAVDGAVTKVTEFGDAQNCVTSIRNCGCERGRPLRLQRALTRALPSANTRFPLQIGVTGLTLGNEAKCNLTRPDAHFP
jgi:hypothetical protein